jgi:hypothetical protein
MRSSVLDVCVIVTTGGGVPWDGLDGVELASLEAPREGPWIGLISSPVKYILSHGVSVL